MAAVYGAENEGSESKVLNVKAKVMPVGKTIDEKDQNDLKNLKQQSESLATIMRSATVGCVKSKVKEGVSFPRKKEMFGNSPQKGVQVSLRDWTETYQVFQV